MGKTLLALLALMLLMSTATAQEDTITVEDINQFIQIYNANVDQVPDFIKSIISNEKINIEVSTAQGTLQFYAVMQDSTIQSGSVGSLDDATLLISTSEETIRRIAASPDPVGELKIALNTGDVSYSGLGFFSSIKYGIISFLSGLFGF
ncbi:MAG: hypothetical protein J4432_03220 [DPANN group archaeon]|nr:hypothetical protein [DPANN group archaeon]